MKGDARSSDYGSYVKGMNFVHASHQFIYAIQC